MREITQMDEGECFHVLATEQQPGSVRALAATARIQQIHVERLSKQAEALNGVAEAQLKSSRALEHYSVRLIRLQWALIWVTVGLLLFTICLAIRH